MYTYENLRYLQWKIQYFSIRHLRKAIFFVLIIIMEGCPIIREAAKKVPPLMTHAITIKKNPMAIKLEGGGEVRP